MKINEETKVKPRQQVNSCHSKREINCTSACLPDQHSSAQLGDPSRNGGVDHICCVVVWRLVAHFNYSWRTTTKTTMKWKLHHLPFKGICSWVWGKFKACRQWNERTTTVQCRLQQQALQWWQWSVAKPDTNRKKKKQKIRRWLTDITSTLMTFSRQTKIYSAGW